VEAEIQLANCATSAMEDYIAAECSTRFTVADFHEVDVFSRNPCSMYKLANTSE
jgi:hypothetical protein